MTGVSLLLFAAFTAFAAPEPTQLVVVTAKDWSSTAGTLRAFVRKSPRAPWRRALGPYEVSLGKHGLAWGSGLHLVMDRTLVAEKREGDGKTPAGIFPIPFALGFDDPKTINNPAFKYVQLGNTVECIDFTDSAYYNQIVDWANIPELKSRMDPNKPRPRELFKVGLFIGQNTGPVTPGFGSCVYLHLRSHQGETTSACTAVDEPVALKLVRWLRDEGHPRYVVLPQAAYAKYRVRWRLP